MKDPIYYMEEVLENSIKNACEECIKEGTLTGESPNKFIIEIPSDTKNGDFSSNFAMANSKNYKIAPRNIAEIVVSKLKENMPENVMSIEIAGPGFVNFYLNDDWFSKTVKTVLENKENYGRTNTGAGKKVMVEFVSANPTGPMHLGNARGGALGDTLASCLDFAGYEASREFYINDAGNQIINLGKSLEARYIQIIKGEDAIKFPEDGYVGDDIKVHAQNYIDEHGEDLIDVPSDERRKILANYVIPKNVEKMKNDLSKYKIYYDTWFSEQSLYDDNHVEEIKEVLIKSGYTYEKDGALWFANTKFGLEKDDVLVRENGLPTYYLVDIAYHYNKFVTRGFDWCIDVWGADHHGHVARMKNAISAVGVDSENFDVVLMQLVHLVRNGEAVRMSKRKGQVITLDNLLDEVSVDAARYYFNSSSPTSHLEFDLGLAVEESSQNPVYYVQYAHARICSIFKNLSAEGICMREATTEELKLLNSPSERELIRQIASLPGEIIDVTTSLDPSKLTKYSHELATKFHKFYADCRIKGQEEGLLQARLNLCKATQIALSNTLALLKVTAPETM